MRNRFRLHDVDISGQIYPRSDHLAHVARGEPYNLHDLGLVSRVGSVLYTDSAQPLTTAG